MRACISVYLPATRARRCLEKGRRAYVHVARGEVDVNATRLLAGDAAKLEDADSIRLANGHEAEILVFDLP